VEECIRRLFAVGCGTLEKEENRREEATEVEDAEVPCRLIVCALLVMVVVAGSKDPLVIISRRERRHAVHIERVDAML
jgi:hypothetical protein